MGEAVPEHQVLITDEAFYSFVALPSERTFAHVQNSISLLANTPYLGRIYDPAYDAQRPPFECRVLYCESYGIYYAVDDGARTVTVFALEDQRRNPQARFSALEYGVEKL